MKRTKEEIQRQIDGLKAMKEKLPAYSKMGDDNHGKIDAQIAVLEGKATPDDYYRDEHSEDYQDGDNEIWSDAEIASEWMKGREKKDLFE